MLRIVQTMAELPFGKLMGIYEQSNRDNGKKWINENELRQIAMAEQEVYAYLRQCFFTRPGSRYFIWEEQGKWLSAVRCESYADGWLLTALETVPEARGRGYAAKLLTGVLESLGMEKVYAHIRQDNQASMAVHLRCGFIKLKSGARLLDGSYSRSYDTYMREKIVSK